MKKTIMTLFVTILAIFGGTKLVDAKENVVVRLSYTADRTELSVGESGQLSVDSQYGVIPKGTFKSQKNDFFELKEDGSFTALKAGTVDITPDFTLSADSEKEIKTAYFKQNNIENANVDDYDIAIQQIQFIIPITIKDSNTGTVEPNNKTRRISSNFKINKSNFRIGESGNISIEPLYGVTPKGSFVPQKNDFFELKEDGSFTTLKAGETDIRPTFIISAESVEEINTAYVAQLSSPNAEGNEFPIPAVQQSLPIKINSAKEQVPITFNFTANPIVVAIGESGKLTLDNIYGVTPKGTFKEEKNDFIQLKEDGTYTGIKAGKAELKPVFTLSNDSIKEIKEAYIKQENKTNLTVDDIELVYPTVQQVVTINVTEKVATTPNGSTKKTSNTNKNLPKTSDNQSPSLVLLGTSVLIVSVGTLIIRKKLV